MGGPCVGGGRSLRLNTQEEFRPSYTEQWNWQFARVTALQYLLALPHLHYDSHRNELHAKSKLTRPRKAALEALKAQRMLQMTCRASRVFSGLPMPRVFRVQANKNAQKLQRVCKVVASNLQFAPLVALCRGG